MSFMSVAPRTVWRASTCRRCRSAAFCIGKKREPTIHRIIPSEATTTSTSTSVKPPPGLLDLRHIDHRLVCRRAEVQVGSGRQGHRVHRDIAANVDRIAERVAGVCLHHVRPGRAPERVAGAGGRDRHRAAGCDRAAGVDRRGTEEIDAVALQPDRLDHALGAVRQVGAGQRPEVHEVGHREHLEDRERHDEEDEERHQHLDERHAPLPAALPRLLRHLGPAHRTTFLTVTVQIGKSMMSSRVLGCRLPSTMLAWVTASVLISWTACPAVSTPEPVQVAATTGDTGTTGNTGTIVRPLGSHMIPRTLASDDDTGHPPRVASGLYAKLTNSGSTRNRLPLSGGGVR